MKKSKFKVIVKQIKFKAILPQITGGVAMLCAVMAANVGCKFLFHQEKEPEAVKKLRRF